ncbi:MAG: MBL fold metallo-hydrolase [Candidatus Taylorbacteria bacterium]
MIITYLGAEFFKVQFGETVIAFNPISKESKFKQSRFGADVALVSLNDKDFNGFETLGFGEKKPFEISGPGEYEIKGIFIKGFKSVSHYGGSKGKINTIYLLSLDGISLCFLGALGGEIDKETMESLDDIDILFTPIGGQGTLEPSASYKIAVNLEPKIIIPMLYDEKGDVLKKFLKEGGEEKAEPQDKLTIKKKDLEGKEGEIVVLAPQA